MPDVRPTTADADIELLRSGIRLMALRALGDADLADEVAQETLSRAVAVINAPHLTANLGAYVAGIARHVIADHYRARERVATMTEAAFEAVRDGAADPLTLLCSDDEAARVRDALDELAPADREVITLCYYDNLTPTEIAERLGVPAERIRQRKLRALQRLRTAFDGRIVPRHASVSRPTVSSGAARAAVRGSEA